jgi:hypothetical protein
MLVRSRRYCCIIGVSVSRIFSELNHAARIASLECELAKIILSLSCGEQKTQNQAREVLANNIRDLGYGVGIDGTRRRLQDY